MEDSLAEIVSVFNIFAKSGSQWIFSVLRPEKIITENIFSADEAIKGQSCAYFEAKGEE